MSVRLSLSGPAMVALAGVVAFVAGAAAQTPAPGRGAAPLRDEPGDWWGDVHRWTGSDATRPGRAAAPARAPAASDGSRRVTTRAAGRSNIRRDPSTAAPVVRVMPPGSVLVVLAEGPEGWLQVGEGAEPIGWIHPSMLQGR